MKKEVVEFLKSQRLMAIASCEGGIWIANVYYGMDEGAKIYFISPLDTKHSQQILKSPDVAFSIAWYDKQSPGNRKAVQGTGLCKLVENEDEIRKGIQVHNEVFHEFKEVLTPEYLLSDENDTKVWILEPRHIKFWNDELYGGKEWEEFDV